MSTEKLQSEKEGFIKRNGVILDMVQNYSLSFPHCREVFIFLRYIANSFQYFSVNRKILKCLLPYFTGTQQPKYVQ